MREGSSGIIRKMNRLNARILYIIQIIMSWLQLDRVVSFIIVKTPVFESYKRHLLSTHYAPEQRHALDHILYLPVLRYWVSREYYPDEDPVSRERKKTLLIKDGSSSWAATYDTERFDLNHVQADGKTLAEYAPLYLRLKSRVEEYRGRGECVIIQVGAASGREIAWFAEQFPEIKCIGTDAFSGAVEYARTKYRMANLEFRMVALEKIGEILEGYREVRVFFYTSGLFHFVQPEFVVSSLQYLSTFKYLDLFISEPVSLPRLEVGTLPTRSTPRHKPLSWTHNYPELLARNGFTMRDIILTDRNIEDVRKYLVANCFIWATPSIVNNSASKVAECER